MKTTTEQIVDLKLKLRERLPNLDPRVMVIIEDICTDALQSQQQKNDEKIIKIGNLIFIKFKQWVWDTPRIKGASFYAIPKLRKIIDKVTNTSYEKQYPKNLSSLSLQVDKTE